MKHALNTSVFQIKMTPNKLYTNSDILYPIKCSIQIYEDILLEDFML